MGKIFSVSSKLENATGNIISLKSEIVINVLYPEVGVALRISGISSSSSANTSPSAYGIISRRRSLISIPEIEAIVLSPSPKKLETIKLNTTVKAEIVIQIVSPIFCLKFWKKPLSASLRCTLYFVLRKGKNSLPKR